MQWDLKTRKSTDIVKLTTDAEYIYRITRHEENGHIRFGVAIQMKSEVGTSYVESGMLFCDEGRTLRFLSFLAEHLVTPIDLPYVIEDALEF